MYIGVQPPLQFPDFCQQPNYFQFPKQVKLSLGFMSLHMLLPHVRLHPSFPPQHIWLS